MIDRAEQQRRGQSPRKQSTKHPFVSIEHRILDSVAFADLKPTAKALIFILARQLNRDNNGHIQATFAWCKRYGIGSEHTLKDSVAQLISHGFLYRTRSHGANGTWATYAFTWLPIQKKEGLFLAGFVSMAWRDWQPSDKKSSPQKVQDTSSRKCSFTPEVPAESAGKPTAETADYESCCHVSTVTQHSQAGFLSSIPKRKNLPATHPDHQRGGWIPEYIERLAARGLAHACPVATLH